MPVAINSVPYKRPPRVHLRRLVRGRLPDGALVNPQVTYLP